MNNEITLNYLKDKYPNLIPFEIKDSILIYHNDDKTLQLALKNFYFGNVEPSILELHANTLFNFITSYELLFLNSLSDEQKIYIENITKNYLYLHNKHLNNEPFDTLTHYALEYLINFAYLDRFSQNPASLIIKEALEKYTTLETSALNKSPRLVLIKGENPNFSIQDNSDYIHSIEKAGYSTIFIILTTVALTSIYVALFVFGH